MNKLLLLFLIPWMTFAQDSQKMPNFFSNRASNIVYHENLDLPSSQWQEYTDISWYNSDQEIFDISSPEELAGLAQLVMDGENFSGKTVNLMGDIDLGAHLWTPIGTGVDYPFNGTFNGNHYTISNLKINLPDASFVGLFGHVVEARIENINLETAEIYGKDTVGSIIANVYTSEVYNCHANNVLIAATDYNIGGLSGSILTGSIMENCSATNVDVSGDSQIGGLLGSVWDASILRTSYSTGEVSGNYIIGGLVGYTTFAFTVDVNIVENCYSRANVTGNLGRVGGFYGMVSGALEIRNSYATGTATASEFEGGFVGVVTNLSSINNYFDYETSGHLEAVGGWEGAQPMDLDILARDSMSMKTETFVDELNQNSTDGDVWIMGEAWNDYYPILQQTLSVTDEVEEDLTTSIQLYPNPVLNEMNVISKTPIQRIEIYNGNSQIVMTTTKSKDIYVSHLPKGVYFVKIKTNDNVVYKKMIKN